MYSHDKPTGAGVANWQTFFKKGSNIGLSFFEIHQNWMRQACSFYKPKKSGEPFLQELFMYARFTEEQLQAAISMCRSDSFLQQLPEARSRIIREEMANHDFSHLHFKGPPQEEFSFMGGGRQKGFSFMGGGIYEFPFMDGVQQEEESGRVKILAEQIHDIERNLFDFFQMVRSQYPCANLPKRRDKKLEFKLIFPNHNEWREKRSGSGSATDVAVAAAAAVSDDAAAVSDAVVGE